MTSVLFKSVEIINSSNIAYPAMSSIPNIRSSPIPMQSSPGNGGSASGELAKYEVQLSDWIHCSSSKTSAGKAKIAEITSKIDAIKTDIKKVDDVKAAAKVMNEFSNEKQPVPKLRFDGLGAWVSVQA